MPVKSNESTGIMSLGLVSFQVKVPSVPEDAGPVKLRGFKITSSLRNSAVGDWAGGVVIGVSFCNAAASAGTKTSFVGRTPVMGPVRGIPLVTGRYSAGMLDTFGSVLPVPLAS